MRYFFSTGEASGELAAVVIAQTIRRIDPHAQFEGIGAQRMRDADFALWRDHTGWASMGPLAALPRIPKLLAIMWKTAKHIAQAQPRTRQPSFRRGRPAPMWRAPLVPGASRRRLAPTSPGCPWPA